MLAKTKKPAEKVINPPKLHLPKKVIYKLPVRQEERCKRCSIIETSLHRKLATNAIIMVYKIKLTNNSKTSDGIYIGKINIFFNTSILLLNLL